MRIVIVVNAPVLTNDKGNVEFFFHPQSNSLPGDILSSLAEEITAVGNNSEAKVIILKSEGEKAFCAGASFDELISIKDFETGKQKCMAEKSRCIPEK